MLRRTPQAVTAKIFREGTPKKIRHQAGCRCKPGPFGHFGGLPVPVNVTVCGDPTTLSKIISVPTCGVVSGGVNVTENLQLFPGASVL